jgi:hypothetical protein
MAAVWSTAIFAALDFSFLTCPPGLLLTRYHTEEKNKIDPKRRRSPHAKPLGVGFQAKCSSGEKTVRFGVAGAQYSGGHLP